MKETKVEEIGFKILGQSKHLDFKPFDLFHKIFKKFSTQEEENKIFFQTGDKFEIQYNELLIIRIMIIEINESIDKKEKYYFEPSIFESIHFFLVEDEIKQKEQENIIPIINKQVSKTNELAEIRIKINEYISEFSEDIHISVTSALPLSGKSSLINTLYRSYHVNYKASLVSTLSQNPFPLPFLEKKKGNNIFIKEIPNITNESDVKKHNLHLVDVVLYVITKNDILEKRIILEESLKYIIKENPNVIIIYTKEDLKKETSNVKLIEYSKKFEISCYSSRKHHFGDEKVDLESLTILYNILVMANNHIKKKDTYLYIGGFLY